MNKLIYLLISVLGLMYANFQSDAELLSNKLDALDKQYSWTIDISNDEYKVEAGRRRGKGNRGRRRGGSGLR